MSPFRPASPAERVQPAQMAEPARVREPPGRHAARPSGGGRHHGHRGVQLTAVGRHHGCRRRGPRRGRRRGGGDHRRRRGGRARDGGGARGAGHGGAVAAEHDRQGDSHRGGEGYTGENGGARPEAHLLHAGVYRVLEPAQPASPLPDIARYRGIGRFGVRLAPTGTRVSRDLSRARRPRSDYRRSAGPRWCRTRPSGAWTPPRWPRRDRRSRSRRIRRSAPWSRRTDRR